MAGDLLISGQNPPPPAVFRVKKLLNARTFAKSEIAMFRKKHRLREFQLNCLKLPWSEKWFLLKSVYQN
jgi:hypothetical protein